MKNAGFGFILCTILAASPAAAQGLEGLFGQFQDKAKATAFDMAVGSQVPALSGILGNLSDSQKASLFDLGVENAGTIGQFAAGASALGAATGLFRPSTDTTAYRQPARPVAFGATQPAYGQPSYGSALPVYRQPAYRQPTYSPPGYAPPVPASARTGTTTDDLVGSIVRLGIQALAN